jgi:acyl-CoA thioester hydrolase
VSTTGPFVHRLRVRYGECDSQGVVFNANYLLYFDVAFTELWRERNDDELDIRVRVVSLGTTSMALELGVERHGELLTEAELHYVFVETDTHVKTAIPPEIRAVLSAIR